jgi:triosephosphate isomerase
LCIGEEKKEDIKKFLKADLEECLKDVKTNKIIIAYEPVWAIGTGKVPGIEELKDITKYIKIKTKELIGCDPILVYGGSVNLDTINGLNEVKELDGYLIGSASLDIKKLKRLIEVVK